MHFSGAGEAGKVFIYTGRREGQPVSDLIYILVLVLVLVC
jgi:hypothetical protein